MIPEKIQKHQEQSMAVPYTPLMYTQEQMV